MKYFDKNESRIDIEANKRGYRKLPNIKKGRIPYINPGKRNVSGSRCGPASPETRRVKGLVKEITLPCREHITDKLGG